MAYVTLDATRIKMTTFLLLTVMLAGGAIFVWIPINQRKRENSSLTIRQNLTKELRAIILFVSDLGKDGTLEGLLAYKVLTQLESSSTANAPKYVWLLHSDISSGDGSSYESAYKISKKFKSAQLQISSYVVDNVLDANTVFPIVRKIISSENFGIPPNEIVCDCTSGTKPITLGMALASFGSAKIIYFPRRGVNEPANEYTEIDAGVFIKSLNVEH